MYDNLQYIVDIMQYIYYNSAIDAYKLWAKEQVVSIGKAIFQETDGGR